MSTYYSHDLYIFAKTREELLSLFSKFDITFPRYPLVSAFGHIRVTVNDYNAIDWFGVSYEPWNGYYVLNCRTYGNRGGLWEPALEQFLNEGGFDWAVIDLSENDWDYEVTAPMNRYTWVDFTFSPSFTLDKAGFHGFTTPWAGTSPGAQHGDVLPKLDCETLWEFEHYA